MTDQHHHHHDDHSRAPGWRGLLLAGLLLTGLVYLLAPARPAGQELIDGERVQGATVVDAGTGEIGELITIRLEDGAEADAYSYLQNAAVGERVFIQQPPFNEGAVADYIVIERNRVSTLVLVVLVLIGLLIVVSRGQGWRSLYGLAGSLWIVVKYLIPALLAGQSPLMVGLIAAGGVLLFSIYVMHGFSRKSAAAIVGLLITILIVGLGAHWFITTTMMTGLGDDQSYFLQLSSSVQLDMVALLLAGVMIAALGSLDDIAITQASIVEELARHLKDRRSIFTRAMSIGRDHITSVTNTLVLAYVATSLPLVMIMTQKQWPAAFMVSTEIMAQNLVLILFPTIGLVIAAPLTTLMATLLVSAGPSRPSGSQGAAGRTSV